VILYKLVSIARTATIVNTDLNVGTNVHSPHRSC